MSARRPLTIASGQVEQLPAGDVIEADGITSPTGSDLALTPATGKNVLLGDFAFPNSDSAPGSLLRTSGGGVLSWVPPPPLGNLLINGGFDFFQRTAPGTLTERSDDTYGPDRWVVLTQTAAVQVARSTGATTTRYAGQLKQHQASAQRMGLLQIVEAADSCCMRGASARFQARVKCSANQTIRVALLEWTGTADSVTSDVVNTWTNRNYTPGNFFLASSLTVVGTGTVLVSPGMWSEISTTGEVSAGCNNLIAFVWGDDTLAQNGTLDVTEAGLYASADFQAWRPRLIGEELSLCLRYFQKSYPIATATGSANAWSGFSQMAPSATWANGAALPGSYEIYRQMLRTNAIAVVYSPNSGTSSRVYRSGVGDVVATFNYTSDRVIGPLRNDNGADVPANSLIQYHYSVDAEL